MKLTCRPILALFVLVFCSTAFAQVTAIKAGRVFDPESGTMAKDQIILVEKGKIISIGSNTPIPAGAKTVDMSTKVVMPGLFDMHTHLCMDVNPERDNGRYYYTTLNDPDSFRAIQGVVNAKTMLESGIYDCQGRRQ